MQRMKTDDVKKLQQKKYREEFACFLAEGEHLVLELEKAALHNPALQASELYVTEAYAEWDTRFHKHLVSERVMQQLSETRSPQGIVARVPTAALAQSASAFSIQSHAQPSTRSDKSGRAVYLYEVQDPGNLGTILRTLAWFGNFSCLLSPGCVDPFNGKVVRSSMGAIFYVPIALDVDISLLRQQFSYPVCMDMTGQSLQSDDFHKADCLIFGNEARGVPAHLLQQTGAAAYTIPGSGQIDSLNLAATVNMCVYELMR
jgi:RNA methyltransferase, TrmH family